MAETKTTLKGFIKDYAGNRLLPITRAELVLDQNGFIAMHSEQFAAAVPDPSNNEDKGKWGLISPEDLALVRTLKGGSTGNGTIATIQQQLAALYSNLGLKVGETSVKFYDSQNSKFNDIILQGDSNIIVSTTAGNTIQLVLNKVTTTKAGSGVITDITTDDYGRVTSITGSSSLSGLSLQNSTASTPEADNSIANKKYVDDKFDEANSIALGALKFGGVIPGQTELNNIGLDLTSNVNSYFKIGIDGLTLSSTYILGGTSDISLKAGDTVIVHKNSNGTGFVYIPSGDEPITTLTVQDEAGGKVESAAGAWALKFASPFVVTPQGATTAAISLPYLGTDPTDEYGLLSRTEYNKFMQYSAKSMSYNATITENSPDRYELGQISFGDANGTPIYGQNTTYTLEVKNGYESGEHLTRDPKLVFTPSSQAATTIQIQGTSGVVVTRNDNIINVAAANTIADDGSKNYLGVAEGHKFKAIIGKVEEDGTVKDGLADFRTMTNYVTNLHSIKVECIKIENSLSSDDTTYDYRYGSEKLVGAITLDI